MRQRRGQADERGVHLPTEQIGNRGGRTLVRDVSQFYARRRIQELTRQVMRRAAAGGAEVVLLRLRLGERDHVLDRLRPYRRTGDENDGRRARAGDGREILHRIERQFAVEAGIDGERNDRHQQRVTVRRGLGDDIGADVAARAAAVVDHHCLPHAVGKFLAHRAGDDVGGAARRKRHDHADCFMRISLRRRRGARCRQRQRGKPFHRCLHL